MCGGDVAETRESECETETGHSGDFFFVGTRRGPTATRTRSQQPSPDRSFYLDFSESRLVARGVSALKNLNLMQSHAMGRFFRYCNTITYHAN